MSDQLRYEVKMVFDALRLDEVRSWVYVHANSFRKAYPLRQVNNVYFDTFDRALMEEHINGVAERAKLRYRWYGTTWQLNGGQFEIKIKNGQLGYKKTHTISADIDISHLKWDEIIRRLRIHSSDSFKVLLGSLSPVLINQYKREYYESMDGSVRITLDYDMRAFTQSFGLSPNIVFEQNLQNNMVIEVKAARDAHQMVADVLAGLPLYCTQNSKYLNGMEYAV